jgi:hypothetical protein
MERKGERKEETHEAVENASDAKPDHIVRGCLKRGAEEGEEHTQSHASCTADLVRDDAACESANDHAERVQANHPALPCCDVLSAALIEREHRHDLRIAFDGAD